MTTIAAVIYFLGIVNHYLSTRAIIHMAGEEPDKMKIMLGSIFWPYSLSLILFSMLLDRVLGEDE
jgi:hypothetical protein